jgi:hypothetical protein
VLAGDVLAVLGSHDSVPHLCIGCGLPRHDPSRRARYGGLDRHLQTELLPRHAVREYERAERDKRGHKKENGEENHDAF